MVKSNLFTTILISTIACLALQAKEGRVTVHVVDESGNPIPGIEVVAQFDNALGPGEGWGTGKPTQVKSVTGKNGVCVLTGSGNLPSVGIGITDNNPYYGNTAGISFTNPSASSFGRWQPWNPTVNIILQKVGIRLPMYAKRVWQTKIPIQGKPVGYDLMAGDWVDPNGKGRIADLLFTFTKKTNGVVLTDLGRIERPLYDNSLTISFPNDGDGIQSVAATGGALRLPRETPTNGYRPELVKHDFASATNFMSGSLRVTRVVPHLGFDRNANYFFRVRFQDR